ncbi:MAG: M56 family metallopeptidase, partial [Lachnospiraceae bacterium]|nr:M56 family metallopeptidase [Lachnospiraceae bacterium]
MTGRENDISLILHHELIHYKRRDIWYKWLFQAALCVHWFNPLLYLFNRKFNVDCELACDEAMMALLSEDGRRIYGNVLLDVAEKNLHEETFIMHRNVPMMTLLEEKCTLKERLREIAKFHKKGFLIGFCSALVLAAFAAVAVVCGAASVRTDSGHVFMMRNESSGIVGRVLKNIPDTPDIPDIPDVPDVPDIPDIPTSSFGELISVNKSGNSYRMYDDDALIAGESENDAWVASNYCGGGNSVDVGKFTLNGSDEVWIVHANKETTLEIFSMFDLRDGRFKFVWIKPDQTVQTLNESGGKKVDKITLPQGRNVIKMVGQKARVKNVSISYGGVIEEDVDGIYRDANQEYAYQALEGKQPIDVSRLEGVCPYLEPGMVSVLFQKAWKEGAVLSERNWMDLFVYSDSEVAGQYLLEELEAGGVEEFDSRILVKIAPYMSKKDVSECFRYLLERGKVSESDLQNIFIYSDADLSARYYIDALKAGGENKFNGKILA